VVEVYPHVFEFTVVDGSIVFNFPEGIIKLRLPEGEKEFPIPANLHNFCVVIGGIIYGTNVTRKQVFFTGRPGERKVIDLRGFYYEKKINENKGQDEEEGENKRTYPRAILIFIDEPTNFKKSFLFNIYNLYALWELFRMQDKVVSVDDLVWERREGNVFLQGIPVPFQKAKALFFALDQYLRTGQVPSVNQVWEYGKLILSAPKKRLDFFRKSGNVLIPSGVININPDNALRIMSVL